MAPEVKESNYKASRAKVATLTAMESLKPASRYMVENLSSERAIDIHGLSTPQREGLRVVLNLICQTRKQLAISNYRHYPSVQWNGASYVSATMFTRDSTLSGFLLKFG